LKRLTAAVGDKYDLLIKDGRVVATLRTSCHPVVDDPEVMQTAKKDVETVFLSRGVCVHRKFTLRGGPGIHRPSGGTITLQLPFISSTTTVFDKHHIVILDENGNIVGDSEANRIEAEYSMLDLITSKHDQSPILRSLLNSYRRAVDDPSNELIHLYEILEALTEHFG
jgi:hypothetical protein